MLGPGGIAPLAQRQLAAWQQLAAGWRLQLNERFSLRCDDCGALVVLLTDALDHSYRVTPQQITDATVMHLRRCHEDLDPDR